MRIPAWLEGAANLGGKRCGDKKRSRERLIDTGLHRRSTRRRIAGAFPGSIRGCVEMGSWPVRSLPRPLSLDSTDGFAPDVLRGDGTGEHDPRLGRLAGLGVNEAGCDDGGRREVF